MWNPNYFQVSTYLKKIQNKAMINLVECNNHIIQSNTSKQILAKKGAGRKRVVMLNQWKFLFFHIIPLVGFVAHLQFTL